MERTPTHEESLDIIARMIASTRQNFNDRGGAMFLIWGYTTIAVTLTVAAMFMSKFLYAGWIWCALPAIGGLFTWLHFRNYKRTVTSHLDTSVGAVWMIFSSAAVCCMISTYVSALISGRSYIDVLFAIGLLMSMGTAITGRLIKFHPVEFGGVIGMGLAFALPAFKDNVWQLPLFAAVFLVAQVIPGHMLNAACKREAAANAGTKTERTAGAAAATNGRAE